MSHPASCLSTAPLARWPQAASVELANVGLSAAGIDLSLDAEAIGSGISTGVGVGINATQAVTRAGLNATLSGEPGAVVSSAWGQVRSGSHLPAVCTCSCLHARCAPAVQPNGLAADCTLGPHVGTA